jgi:ribosomal protein L16 Arg81 hydroxylase
MVRNLSELLEPCPTEEFFATNWGKKFRYIKGWPGKFADLLTWERLDEIVCRYEFDHPRVHLFKDHQVVPPDTYLKYVTNRRDKKLFRAKLQGAALNEQLRQGASLVVDNVEEVSGQPLLELTADLQRIFHENIAVNAYGSFKTTNALNVHWDAHDVLIVQVAGQKHWSLYGETRPYPLEQDIAPNTEPTTEPIWEGMIEDGDVLYIPRGCWHYVVPAGPSIHLSMGIFNRTGLDLLDWVTRQLRSSQTFRMDLPRFASPEQKEAHVRQLGAELLEAWNSELLDKFFDYTDGMAESRPKLGLPWSVLEEVLPDSDEARVRLASLRALNLKLSADGKTVSFFSQGKRWKLPSQTLPVLQALNEGERSTNELCVAADGKLGPEAVRKFIKQLVTQGLIVPAETPEESAAMHASR